jgi:hypothetical protein
MSRIYKGYVWKISIFLIDWPCQAVRLGIIGRLGNIFGLGLNFFREQDMSFLRKCRIQKNSPWIPGQARNDIV